jgi:hypothetical protein
VQLNFCFDLVSIQLNLSSLSRPEILACRGIGEGFVLTLGMVLTRKGELWRLAGVDEDEMAGIDDDGGEDGLVQLLAFSAP